MHDLAGRYPHLFAAYHRWLYRQAMRGHRTAIMERSAPGVLELMWRGVPVTVRKNTTHPEYYSFIEIGGRVFFLGVIQSSMRRGDVRRMAARWLREHPQHLPPKPHI